MVPRPSFCGAFVWALPRGAVAVTFSRVIFGYSACLSMIALGYSVQCAPLIGWIVEHWKELATALLLLNAGSATVVWMGPSGVRARRVFVPWERTQRAPLGGRFGGCVSAGDWEDDDESAWNTYEAFDGDGRAVIVSFATLRPEATAEWLTAQLRRIHAQQVPVARTLEHGGGGRRP